MSVAVQITPTQSDVQKAIRAFLTDVLPAGVPIIAAQANRVPEPKQKNFVIISPLRFERLATNLSRDLDNRFTGSVAGSALTVSAVDFGEIRIGSTLFGVGVADGTRITAQSSGPAGGAGVYVVSNPQTIAAETLSSGLREVTLESIMTVQLDFHSEDYTAGQMAQTAATLLRDPYGTKFFEGQGIPLAPLYADDPRMLPFTQDQSQWEWRWTLDAKFQLDQTVLVSAQYADSLSVLTINVDAAYPP